MEGGTSVTAIHPELSPKSRYWIDRHRYYELKHFCLQYPLWIRARASLDGLSRRALRLTPPSPTGLVQSPTSRCAEQRLWYTERIAMVEDEESRLSIEEELIDRFGDIPKSVDNLLRVAELKAMAHRAYVTEVDINTQEIRIELYPKAKLDVTGIPALIAEYKTALRFAQGEKPVLFYQDKGKKHKDCEPMMEKAKELLGKLGELAESRK